MTKHDRGHSSADASQETTENLYELGLLNRPRDREREGTSNVARTVHCKNFTYFRFTSTGIWRDLFQLLKDMD